MDHACAVKAVFRTNDATCSGQISTTTLLQVLKSVGCSDEQTEKLLTVAGAEDGQVDYNKFVDIIFGGFSHAAEQEVCLDRLGRVVYQRSKDFYPKSLPGEQRTAWIRQRLSEVPMKVMDPSLSERERQLLRWSMSEYIAERSGGRVTCEDYTRLLVKQARYYRYLNQWVYTTYSLLDRAIEKAVQLDAKAAADGVESISPLYGLPIPMKGTSAVIDYPSGAGCGLLTAYPPVKNSAMTERILDSNGIVFGTTNVPPFALNILTANACSGVTRNPYGHSLTVGGSSGGAASAVASHLCPVAVTEDTGGSTRIPAFSCQLFGFDPARNHYPNEGNTAISYSKDQIGVVARSFDDVLLYDRLVMGTRHGADKLHEQAAAAASLRATSSIRVGTPKLPFTEEPGLPSEWKASSSEAQAGWVLESSCANMFAEVKEALAAAGIVLVEEEWPSVPCASLGRVVNAMVKALYEPKTVNGKPFHPMQVYSHSMAGQVAQWVREYLDADVSLKEIQADTEGGGITGEADETQFRYYLGPYMSQLVDAYNSYFDRHAIDFLLVPASMVPTPDFADVRGGTVKVPCVDGSVHEMGVRLYFPHFIEPIKELHVPKLLVPTGLTKEGRPMAVQLWGRAVAYDAMFEDVESTKQSVSFLYLVRHVVSAIHSKETLQRKNAPLVADLF